ncbi:sensor histidine kinase [Streptococcus saliviloxodontae]|uniref:Two-component system sensor histidine kinase AgrC n=1 Tax=Streptococcus saliviloxodontae TaxID=1349416 RepID=A0ABS2PIW7_9STRE|nr:GHKL domain-containing protein [Streptococcus saliviloxodontae]MBM7635217.1 two-component system sensor histidine kinase AgrC [Streptococcus saliviloxodontae]
MGEISAIVLTVLATILMTWYTYADASQQKLPLGQVAIIAIIELIVSSIVPRGRLVIIPFVLLIYDYYHFPTRHLREHFFISFLPPVLVDLIYRVFAFFILPTLIPLPVEVVDNNDWLQLLALVLYLPSYLLLKRLFSLDYHAILEFEGEQTERLLKLIDGIFVVYGAVAYFLFIWRAYSNTLLTVNVDYIFKIVTAMSFVVLLYILSYLNRYSKQLIKSRIKEEQVRHLQNLETHSKQIENLYQNIRSFKHDYENILISLRGSIDSGDIGLIKHVYEDVLEKSIQELNQDDATIAELVTLKSSEIKSLLSSKVLEMQEKNIEVSLHFPDTIEEIYLEPLDMIMVVTALLDNAIEAALLAENPAIWISYYQRKTKQYLTIENQMKENSFNNKGIFDEHFSTRSRDRGYGLYTVKKILENYPSTHLLTVSRCHHFKQVLEMNKRYYGNT